MRQGRGGRGRVDLGVKSAAAGSRLVGGGGVEQVEACSDLELGVVVGERVPVEVIGAHELLQLLQLPHVRQVTAKDLGARALGVREIVAVQALQRVGQGACEGRGQAAEAITSMSSTPDMLRMVGK